jgi:hypothetical protein
MKNHRFITLCTTLFALGAAAVVFVPVTRAADDEVKETAAAARKAKREKELEKYDANHDGKLEASEKAVEKADKDKAKAEKKEAAAEKKKKKEADKTDDTN